MVWQPLYEGIEDPHLMGQDILYNPPTAPGSLKTPEEVAKVVQTGVITPERSNGDYTRSGGREVWAKQLKTANPNVKLARYMTSHSGMKGDKAVHSNQPFHDGELSKLLDQYPDLAMRSPTGKLLEKGGDKKYPMYVIDPAFRTAGGYLLTIIHERELNEVLSRAPGLYDYTFWDDFGMFFLVWEGKDGSIVPTKQYGDPYSDAWFEVFSAHAVRMWELSAKYGLPMWVNMSTTEKYNESRFRPLVRRLARPIKGVPTRFMHEYFITDWQGRITAETVETSMQEALIVFQEGGLQLFRPKINPANANPNGSKFEEARFSIYAAQVMNSGNAQVRMADEYSQFISVPLIDEIGKITGKFVPGEAGYPVRLDKGVWQRQFENGIVRIDGNTKKAEFIAEPYVPPVIPPVEPERPSGLYTVKINVNGATLQFDAELTPKK